MNYKDYFSRLSKLEERLFEEGYWKVAFVDSYLKEIPMITHSMKWVGMCNYLFSEIDLEKDAITPEMIEKYMDNPTPKKPKKKSMGRVVNYKSKDGTIRQYEYDY